MDKYLGKRLDGRYEIREIIGVGGMACVYKAYDTIDDRIVSIKILKDEYLTNEEFTRRFKNESKAIAILAHPNIVKVYDVSFGDRFQYIVMEYIDGITLKEYIDQQKIVPWKEALHFTVQILRALQHAHDKGIIHRDIKPQNIMLLPDGTIKVMDFGIAQFSRQEARFSTGGETKAIGSVHYISPEQAKGEITDEKADLYSVGVMLYEMLTGCLPFEADNAVSVAIMQLQSEPKKPREVNPDIPESLEEITLKAMQKDPGARYQSAAEMLYDIDEFKRDPSIHFAYKYQTDPTPRYASANSRIKTTPVRPRTETVAEEEDDEDDEPRGSMLPILAAIAGALVLIVMIFVGIWFAFDFISKPGVDNVTVPELVGKMYADVTNNSDYNAKFNFQVNGKYDDTVPEGEIMDQKPAGGKEVKMKSTVELTVSRGPQTVEVPQIKEGRDKTTARTELETAGFQVQEVSESSSTVAANLVIRTEPAYPEKAPKGTTIVLYVSNGPEPVPEVQVPGVTNVAQEDAIAKLKEKGFIVDESAIEVVNAAGMQRGYVVSQTPEGGTMAQPGTKVKLTVSSGYQDVQLLVDLPQTSTQVDLQVYVDGELKTESELGVDQLTRLLPSDKKTLTLTLTAQRESYPVTIRIAAEGTGAYQVYKRFLVNGTDGTATEVESNPFNDPYAING
ncbi:MAG: Stk1 family PASTA domain-containing Ser/Thr kinase [Acutalibacteraceae bacterium]